MLFHKLCSSTKALLVATALISFTTFSLSQTGATVSSTSSSPVNTPYVPTMTFDVASVRENNTVDATAGVSMGGDFAPNTTLLRLVNCDIQKLIEEAYGLEGEQVDGIPKWPFPTLFTIDAKSDSAADAKMAALKPDQQKAEHEHMLQALLQDRFRLKTHWETRQGDVYKLVVAKSGSRLRPAGSMQPSQEESKSFGESLPPIYQRNDEQGYDFVAHECSMGQLVETLAVQFGRPVTNETGLTGKYDFILKYKGRWDRDRDASDLDPTPPLDRALQEELGLRLESLKGPVKRLIIDHVEKPSKN
jgi:uncharacterized protein (TIGR03435 family)